MNDSSRSWRSVVGVSAFVAVGAVAPLIGDALRIGTAAVLIGLLVTGFLGFLRPGARGRVSTVLAAEAANTPIIVIGFAFRDQAGLADAASTLLVFGLLGASALATVPLWRRTVERLGPRNLMLPLLLLWAVVLTVLALYRTLDLPTEVLWVVAPLLGVTYSALRFSVDALSSSDEGDSRFLGWWTGGAVVLPILWMLVAPGSMLVSMLVLVAVSLVAFVSVLRMTDPIQRMNPLAAAIPWAQTPRRELPGGARNLLATPFTALLLIASWAVFLPLARRTDGFYEIDAAALREWLFAIPDLFTDPVIALRSLFSAPVLNHHSVQLVYVTVLLLAVGLVFEAREGTLRALIVFYGTTIAGGIIAAILLRLVYPAISDAAFFERAWTSTWSGASVGAFGLMGATAARARLPWPLFGFFVFWELNVGLWYLQSYTPAFHLTALTTGYLLARYVMRPKERAQHETARGALARAKPHA